MAETILIPVAKQILGKASDLALEQIGLLWNFKRELRKLEDTVATIQAVLRDAEEKQFHNHQVKLWLEKLSDAMYDADDLLDDLSTEARRKAIAAAEANEGRGTTSCWSVVCFLFSSLPKQLVYDLRMAQAIKVIREKLDVISKDKETFHLEVRRNEEEEAPLRFRETDSCPPVIVVGREDDKKNVIELLLNSNCDIEANISAVPVVGMGGLGKTTLAQLVFHDGQVDAHFDIKVWVYVSEKFDVKAILGKMLSMTGRSQVGLVLDDLQAKLRAKIKGKRFLFVLDDVWEENVVSWEALGKYLTVGALGSKVLVTTRSTKVAEIVARALKPESSTSVVMPYLLEGLSMDESWNLLVKKALNGKVPRNPFVERIGRKILENCHGVPLAIATISGLLSSKNPESEWELFLKDEVINISKEENDIVSTLKLSFNHLPPHMKKCFTYCKLFPKGYYFDVRMLVQHWVAHGYVESEDKGFDCFRMLWWRSFFQEVEMDEDGNMLICKMHDLMHDLADLLAGEKIIFISSLAALKSIPPNSHHLTLFEEDDVEDDLGEVDDDVEFFRMNDDALGNASTVRTLICYGSLPREEFERILYNCMRLRVLVIDEESLGLDALAVLHSIDKLKHLRYLGVYCNEMERLPDSVTNLVNLQVLHLISCRSLEELPREIRKLGSLKHLMFNPEDVKCLTYMPKGIGVLKFLQTLPIFVVSKRSSGSDNEIIGAGLEELKGLNALHGKLIIRNLAEAESLDRGIYVLKEKLHLQSLVLDWSQDEDGDSDHVDNVTAMSTHEEETLEMLLPHHNLKKLYIQGGFGGVKLPNWLSSLTNLIKLSLKDCKQCKYLPPLHQISCLKKLKIKRCPELKGINDDGRGGNALNSSPNNSTAAAGVEDEWPWFPCLAKLYINDCPKLTRMPTFPTVEGELKLVRASLEPLVRTMKMEMRRGGVIVQPLSKLTTLTIIEIDDEMVQYMPPLHKLPSLKVLYISKCPKLKGCWWKKKKKKNGNNDHNDCGDDHCYHYDPSMEGEEDDEEVEWPHFPCLARLRIKHCPNLTQMPLFPTLEHHLVLQGTSSGLLFRTLKMKMTTSASSSMIALSKLKWLCLGDIDDLEYLPEEGLCNLTSLRDLEIENCRRLASLPPAMQHLTSLEFLRISECPQLTERCRKGEGEDWPNISHIPHIQLDWDIIQGSQYRSGIL